MAHVSERWILGNGPTDPEDCSRSDSHFCQLNLLPLGQNTGDKSQRRNTGVLFKYQSWEEALLLSHGQNELSGKKERKREEWALQNNRLTAEVSHRTLIRTRCEWSKSDFNISPSSPKGFTSRFNEMWHWSNFQYVLPWDEYTYKPMKQLAFARARPFEI